MPFSSKKKIALRALKYVSDYLKRVDVSYLNPVVASGLSDVIDDLDGLISLESSDLPF